MYSSQCNCYFTIWSNDKKVLRIHFKYKRNLENIHLLKNFAWQSPENLFIISSGLLGKNAHSDLENSIQQTASLECTERKYRVEWTVTGIALRSTGQQTWYFVSCFLTSVGNLFPFWRSVSISTTPLTLNTIWFCVLSRENARKKTYRFILYF